MDIFLYFIYGTALFFFSAFFPYTGLLVSAVFLLLIFFHKYKSASLKIPYIAVIIIFSASGFFYAKATYSPQTTPSELQGRAIEVKGVIKSERLSSSYRGTSFLQNISVIEASDNDGEKLFLKELRALNEKQLDKEKIHYFKGRFSKDGYSLNPDSNNYPPTFYVQSSVEIGNFNPGFFERMRTRLNSFIRSSFSDESSAFLLSITTGERIFLTSGTRNAFNVTGLAHILSISGAHFGLLFVVLFGLFKIPFRYMPYKLLARLTIYVSPSQVAAIMTAPFLLFYLGISSLSIPSIRAFIMITFFLAGLLIGRKGFWLNTLTIAAFIIVLISPDALTDLSFQLSFIAVLCIGIAAERLRKEEVQNDMTERYAKDNFLASSVSFIFKYLRGSLLISLAATAGTAPLVAYHFHYFSLISPLTNLVITPLIGFLILPATLFSSLMYLAFDFFPLIPLLDKFTLSILGLIENIARWNYTDIKVPAFPIILLITFYTGLLVFTAIEHLKNKQPEKSRILLYAIPLSIAILPFFIYTGIKIAEPKGLSITYLDVGQGDAAVAELADDRIIVIDTGKSGYQVGEYLRYRGIRNIDALAISHMESDHAGGMEYLLNNFNVIEIWGNGIKGSLNLQEQILSKYRRLHRADVVEGNGYKILVLHPYDKFYTSSSKDDENNYSLVFKITGYQNSFLFTGDVEREAQEDLANLKHHLNSNVLKVPHHGSKSSAYENFYHFVSPEIAVISVGRKNPHGHPHEDTLSMLSGTAIYRTDIDGAIGFREMPDGSIKVKTCREFQFTAAQNQTQELSNLKRLFSVW